jgi:hypothetical protein
VESTSSKSKSKSPSDYRTQKIKINPAAKVIVPDSSAACDKDNALPSVPKLQLSSETEDTHVTGEYAEAMNEAIDAAATAEQQRDQLAIRVHKLEQQLTDGVASSAATVLLYPVVHRY